LCVPQPVDHLGATDGPVGIEEQQGHQGALLGAAEVDPFVAIPDLKRAE
jgi:hypothetical protein